MRTGKAPRSFEMCVTLLSNRSFIALTIMSYSWALAQCTNCRSLCEYYGIMVGVKPTDEVWPDEYEVDSPSLDEARTREPFLRASLLRCTQRWSLGG